MEKQYRELDSLMNVKMFKILQSISAIPKIETKIKNEQNLSHAFIFHKLKVLDNLNIIKKSKVEDGRAKACSLTPKGKKIFINLKKIVNLHTQILEKQQLYQA